MTRILSRFAWLVVTLLVGGFLGAVLLRMSPGADVDERDLDGRYSATARAGIHLERAAERDIVTYYLHYLNRAAHGDFGVSRTFAMPVSSLISARAGVTARLIGGGLTIAWTLGLGLAVICTFRRNNAVLIFAEALSGLALSLPAAVVALLIFLVNGPVPLVIGIAISPRVFRFARDLFVHGRGRAQVLAARARGVPEHWVFVRYIMRPALAPLVALAGVCVSLAFGAAIPVETICDLPGLGHLALKAALGRDLPLLIALTLLVTAVTLTANAVADAVLESSRTGAPAR